MIKAMGVRPIIFSVNCYIATILTMFIAFGLDLKSPGWAMTTVYLTSQPLSGTSPAMTNGAPLVALSTGPSCGPKSH
jgi:Fusaric acid resistance protein family